MRVGKLLCTAALAMLGFAGAANAQVVISQFYGGGGATSGSPTYNQDFIELHNKGQCPVVVPAGGWSVQYGSATGNFGSSGGNIATIPAGTVIPAGGFLLVVGAAPGGTTTGAPLPVAGDITSAINASATNGKVALITGTAGLGNASCTDARIIDVLGFGTANCGEGGTPIAALSTTTAAIRNANGCDDTGSNVADFTIGTPIAPRNSSSAPVLCVATPMGACCVNGNCNGVTDESSCVNGFGGTWFCGETCGTVVCPAAPVGGCCVNGVCELTQITEAACQAISGGTWLGAGVVCDGTNCFPPTGGCCIAGECSPIDVTQVDCESLNGTWLGAGVACDGSNCMPVARACCFGDGTCQILLPADCGTAGGTSGNVGSVCSPNGCAQPAWTGACCEGTACNVRTFADCSAINDAIWLGKNAPCESGTCDQTTAANLIAKVDFDVNRQWSTFVIDTDHGTGPFDTGDAFGVLQRFTAWPEPVPFNLLDDSVSLFPAVMGGTAGDNLGVIPESKIDHFFGMVDIKGDANGNYVINPAAPRFATATWTFDISGRSNISVQFDAAAMGDFERAATCSSPPCDEDTYTFKVSIDGGAETTIFDARADQDINETYTMAGGGMFTLDDPLVDQVSMVVLSNSFQTFSASVSGTGATLTLKFEGYGDGAAEVFAFDNIMIMGDSGTLTPCQKVASYDGNTSVVEVVDLFTFLDKWFADFPGAPTGAQPNADFDNDGTVEVSDLFDFLDIWFAIFGLGGNCP